jgi:hypothetical protein
MRKTLKYTSFVLTSLLVILAFVTATTYAQLGIAVILYPIIAFFAYKLFVVNGHKKSPVIAKSEPPAPAPEGNNQPQVTQVKRENIGVADIDKRAFLKIIGAAGISFFLFSLINRRAEGLFFGKSGPSISTLTDGLGNKISPAEKNPTDGYTITEIDDQETSYYGFTNSGGGWYIMKENGDGSFRYAKGEEDFPGNWDHRSTLNYDYYNRVF